MTYIRQNVWELGAKWADPILWYARGVAAMKERAIAEPTSWRFYAAIHGIDQPLWTALGYLKASDQLPGSKVRTKFWKQCQHGSWYFLPWHRGYLLAFEANIRAAVVELGGPADWALPYWNYFKTGQSALPAEFRSPAWPDAGTNPLYVGQRYGPNDDSHVHVPLRDVNLRAMQDARFTGVSSGGSPGFGGVDTGFSHGGPQHGGIESQPHDMVHVLVGGANPTNSLPGLMSDPDTAALDPIFWLHHANIDRLWAAWNHGPPAHDDPSARTWLKGPANVGQRAFVMPMPNGTTWQYMPAELVHLRALEYRYDDLSPKGAVLAVAADQPAESPAIVASGQGGDTVPARPHVDLVGANDQAVTVRGPVSSRVRLDVAARRDVAAAFAPGTAVEGGDRLFLNLENVRGQSDASAFRVYVGVPDGEDVDAHADRLAGSVAPFGLRKASQPDGEHAGQGLNFVFDITAIVDQLHAEGSFDVDDLPVRLVPVRDLADQRQVSVGRISIYRERQ